MTFLSNQFECVITGCLLIDNVEHKQIWGDLHSGPGVWIFNGVENPEPLPKSQAEHPKSILAYGHWHRRHVWIIPKDQSELSPEALAYIYKGKMS